MVHNIVKRCPSSPQAVLFEKPSCYHDGHSHIGSRILWKIIVTQHRPLLHQETWKCIMQRGRHLFILHRNAAEFSGPAVIWYGPKDSGNVFQHIESDVFRILRAKDEKYHPDCSQQKVQKTASVMVWRCISAHGMGDLQICEGTIDAEAYVGILETYAAVKMMTSPRN